MPVAKIRAAMKDGRIETAEIPAPEVGATLSVERMFKPEPTGRAEILEGAPEEVSDRLIQILSEQGIL